MANTKIVLIGGGSYGWGPSVVGNILRNEFLDGREVAMHDRDGDALELLHG